MATADQVKALIKSHSEGDDAEHSGADNLGGVRPALGLGILFLVGPNWNVRLDLGIENIGAGLVLRF